MAYTKHKFLRHYIVVLTCCGIIICHSSLDQSNVSYDCPSHLSSCNKIFQSFMPKKKTDGADLAHISEICVRVYDNISLPQDLPHLKVNK